jgi:hypothetical protein
MPRTLKSRKRGGGIFNVFTRKKVAPAPSVTPAPKKSFFSRFTRKNVQPVETVNPAFALAQTSKPSKSFFSRFSRKKPNNVKTTNPISILKERRYESVQEGIERSMSFAFQKLDGGRVDPEKLYLSPEEKKILQARVLSVVREQGEYFGNNETQNEIDVFCQALFGQSLTSFDKELRAWENSHPNPMIIPFAATSAFARLIGLILDTDRERQHYTNTDAQACIGNSNGTEKRSLSAKTLNTDTCMVITNTPDSLENAMEIGDTFYIIVNPKFWTRGASGRYQSKYYKVNKPTFATIQTKYAVANSSIQDAFLNKGLTLIEPRLGFLFQKEAPELWNRHYWLPKFSTNPALVHNYNDKSNIRNNNGSRMYLNEAIVNDVRKPDSVKDVLRIVLLTLQKYSSLRRFAFTKNPTLCSQIYSDYYVNNAVELLRPDVDLPESGYKFNRDEFDKEFADNQRWANPKGIALFKSFDDPRLQVFFKTTAAKLANPTVHGFVWLKLRFRKNVMEVPFEPLPNVETMVNQASMAFRPNKALPYTPMNELHEFVEN